MARRGSKFGECRICGIQCKLSFEHVPPRSALNDKPLIQAKLDQLLAQENLDKLRGKTMQGGIGAFTLCPTCNTKTGRWYSSAYASWAHQGLVVAEKMGQDPECFHPVDIHPLRVIKQVIAMFFSTNSEGFRHFKPELVRFVLNPNEKNLDPGISIWTYLNVSGRSRTSGNIVRGTFGAVESPMAEITLLSEISFPPWGYIMTYNSDPAPDVRLLDIAGFARYGYDELSHLFLRLPILHVYSPFPADFRPREQVKMEAEQSRQSGPDKAV